MAHSSQAKKRVRQMEKQNAANSAQRSAMRTHVKNLEKAVAAQDAESTAAIPTLFKAAMASLHQAGRKGLVSKGMADRKISRLAALIKRTNAGAQPKA